ncbi:MAG: DUF433 domain-containing protein [Acidobacteria bacterium]|nr:DUF433 domain-containing protein [Acidobacteriota bacterium]
MRTKTAYRYISRSNAVCGGQPIITGTRTPVKSIVGYYKLGLSVEEILEGLPHLTPAQVHEALSYYHDHQEEIERDIASNRARQVLKRHGLKLAASGRVASRPDSGR